MPTINHTKCIRCSACIKECVLLNCLSMEGDKLTCVERRCNRCGHCVAVCPQNALSIPEYDMDDVEPITSPNPIVAPSDLLSIMKQRRSIRRFTDEPVTKEELDKLVKTVQYAPTAGNRQDVSVIIVQDKLAELIALTLHTLTTIPSDHPIFQKRPEMNGYTRLLARLQKNWLENSVDHLAYGAPAVILFIGENGDNINPLIAASRCELMAHTMGLGSIFIGFLEVAATFEPVRRFLDIKDGQRVASCLAVGHTATRYYRTAPRLQKKATYM